MTFKLDQNFRRVFIFSLVWLLLEGILRKWLLFNLTGPLFYVKYLLFGLSYTLFLLSKNTIPAPKQLFQVLILTFLILCLFSLTNNRNNNSIIVAIIGLVVHLFFIPMIHLNQFVFNTIKHIKLLGKVLAILAFPICVLGMIQFYLPIDHALNGFANEEQLISHSKGFNRISSIFSFVKIYNAYLLFSVTFLASILLDRLLKNEQVWLYVLAIILLVINMFMTGSRLPILLMVFNMCALGIFSFISFASLRKTVFVTFVLGILTITILYFTTNVVSDPIDATLWRFEKAESRHRSESTGYTDVQLRLEDRLDVFKFSEEAGWMGYGIGMTYQGAFGFIKNPIPMYFEEEGERIVLELGIIGGVIVILMRFFIFIFSFGVLRWCKSIENKLILLSMLLYIAPSILTIQMTSFSYLENFFYYFSFGLIIALYKIEQKQYSNEL
jgi:hypothetical protein